MGCDIKVFAPGPKYTVSSEMICDIAKMCGYGDIKRFSAISGISDKTITKILQAEKPKIQYRTLAKICKATGSLPEELVIDEKE